MMILIKSPYKFSQSYINFYIYDGQGYTVNALHYKDLIDFLIVINRNLRI